MTGLSRRTQIGRPLAGMQAARKGAIGAEIGLETPPYFRAIGAHYDDLSAVAGQEFVRIRDELERTEPGLNGS